MCFAELWMTLFENPTKRKIRKDNERWAQYNSSYEPRWHKKKTTYLNYPQFFSRHQLALIDCDIR